MLILTRRVGETVMIGDEVTVTVLRVKGNQVRLGVNAPKTISVQREEIFQAHPVLLRYLRSRHDRDPSCLMRLRRDTGCPVRTAAPRRIPGGTLSR